MRKMHSKEELEALVSGGGGISYSTEEQDTGLTWIDGKKIYQKTFSKTNIAGEEIWYTSGTCQLYHESLLGKTRD